ncbi:F-box/FBD/LRR-repeat protein At4g00160 [Linum grandiflorum]
MKKLKHGNESTLAGNDPISELPDESIHYILRFLNSSREAALTTALSRRWRSPWRSYPIVEFDYKDRHEGSERTEMEYFQEFSKAAIERFNRDKLLLMESLKVSLPAGDEKAYSALVEQLLDLASERKCEEISIIVSGIGGLQLPFHSLCNSSMRILRLEGINLAYNQSCALPLYSLRCVHLENVILEDDRLLVNLIANARLLETLKLISIGKLSKLQVRNLTSLKRLQVYGCHSIKEIDIAAPGLQTLLVERLYNVTRIEIIAPELTVLQVKSFKSRLDDLALMISKFKSLKSLDLHGYHDNASWKKLKLSNPKLKKFTLWLSPSLEEIEFDIRPGLVKFVLLCFGPLPNKLKIIRHAAIANRDEWKVSFSLDKSITDTHAWIVGLKNFITKFTQFCSVQVHCPLHEVTFRGEEVDHTTHPRAIEKLVIFSDLVTSIDQRTLLNALFWIFHPKLLTIVDSEDGRAEKLSLVFLNLISMSSTVRFSKNVSREESNEHWNWLRPLHCVKMTVTEVPRHSYFELTWY